MINRKIYSTNAFIQGEKTLCNYTKFTTGSGYFKKGPHLIPSAIGVFKGTTTFWTQIRDKLQRSCGDREISFVSIVTPRKSTEPGSFLIQNFISALFILIFAAFSPFPHIRSYTHMSANLPPAPFALSSSACLCVCHTPKESAQGITCSFPHSLTLLWRCNLLLTCLLLLISWYWNWNVAFLSAYKSY